MQTALSPMEKPTEIVAYQDLAGRPKRGTPISPDHGLRVKLKRMNPESRAHFKVFAQPGKKLNLRFTGNAARALKNHRDLKLLSEIQWRTP